MAHGVEGHTTFLEHRLTEHVDGPGSSAKTVPGEKWILKEAVNPSVTEAIYKPGKPPFLAPFMSPSGDALQNLMREIVTRESVEKLGLVDGNLSKISLRKDLATRAPLLSEVCSWLGNGLCSAKDLAFNELNLSILGRSGIFYDCKTGQSGSFGFLLQNFLQHDIG